MSRSIRLLVFALLGFGLLLPGVAAAHEHGTIGQYEFVVGFINEPAFEGEQNGLWVKVTDTSSNTPVENLADILKARVIFGNQELDLNLKPAWDEKGVYTADFYPTMAGDYTFQLTGTVADTSIDERFTSSPEGFDSVKSSDALQFPTKVLSPAEVSTEVAAAQSTARTALWLGGIGLALGIVGTLAALSALRSRRTPASTAEPTIICT